MGMVNMHNSMLPHGEGKEGMWKLLLDHRSCRCPPKPKPKGNLSGRPHGASCMLMLFDAQHSHAHYMCRSASSCTLDSTAL
jgi:hypothetical protein